MTKGQMLIKLALTRKRIDTISDLGRMCGVSPQFMWMLLRGKRSSAKVLGCAAEILGMDRERLIKLTLQ